MIDVAVKIQALQERYKSKTEIQMVNALDQALQNVIGKLSNTEDLAQQKRLNTLKALIEKEIGDLYGEATDPIKQDMAGFAKVSHKTIFEQLNNETNLGYAFAAIPKETMKSIIDLNEVILMGDKGYTIQEMFKTSSENQINRYKQIINAGLASNSGYREITKQLKAANETGMTEIQAIVHTAISSARDKADGIAFDAFDEVIIGWKSVGVLDNRTTLICAALDGDRYMKKDGFKWNTIPNKPPRHFRCRSIITPLTDLDEDGDTRAANGDTKGQVPAKLTFQKWFDRQSPSFQKKYLGTARFELYKNGKMKISSFVDVKTGEKFTLDEIESML
jgi:SPP1 gp7 family putative phage head morphogenesis protein